MWSLISSSKYLQFKYYRDDLARHYKSMHDVDVNYYNPRLKPIDNVPSNKGQFLLGVEKDKKPKAFRRAYILSENQK